MDQQLEGQPAAEIQEVVLKVNLVVDRRDRLQVEVLMKDLMRDLLLVVQPMKALLQVDLLKEDHLVEDLAQEDQQAHPQYLNMNKTQLVAQVPVTTNHLAHVEITVGSLPL